MKTIIGRVAKSKNGEIFAECPTKYWADVLADSLINPLPVGHYMFIEPEVYGARVIAKSYELREVL